MILNMKCKRTLAEIKRDIIVGGKIQVTGSPTFRKKEHKGAVVVSYSTFFFFFFLVETRQKLCKCIFEALANQTSDSDTIQINSLSFL
jgi:hypothetical protein